MWCDWQFWSGLCPPAASPALWVPYSVWSFSKMTRVAVFFKEGGRAELETLERDQRKHWKRENERAERKKDCFGAFTAAMWAFAGREEEFCCKISSQPRCMQRFQGLSNKYGGVPDETLSQVGAVVLLGLDAMFLRLRFHADYYNWLNESFEENSSKTSYSITAMFLPLMS